MDVVYPLKATGSSLELRFSLRSIAQNLPHRKVWLSGHRPMWTTNVQFIRGKRTATKYADALANIVRACERKELSDDFILMNDDFYVLKMHREVPIFHRGPLAEFIAAFKHRSNYYAMMKATLDLLHSEGIDNPLFYGTHTPTVMNKHRVLDIVSRFEGRPFMLRTVYHNLFGPEGTYRDDVKKQSASDKITGGDFLSSSDRFSTTHTFRRFIRSRFPYMCYYEAI
jgi:hypothetical protein